METHITWSLKYSRRKAASLSISKLNWIQPIEIQSCWDMEVILRYRYLFNLPFSAIKIDEPPRHSQGAESPWFEQLKVRLNPPLKAPPLPNLPPAGKDMTPRNLSESPPDIRFMKHLRACNDDLMHPIPCAVVIPLLHIAAPNLIHASKQASNNPDFLSLMRLLPKASYSRMHVGLM